MSEMEPTKAEVGLARIVAIWRNGEAAEEDPVLINMLAREAADLNRLVPGAADKVRDAFEDMKAHDLSMSVATKGWPSDERSTSDRRRRTTTKDRKGLPT